MNMGTRVTDYVLQQVELEYNTSNRYNCPENAVYEDKPLICP